MSTPAIDQTAADAYASGEDDQANPFELDITFIENTPDADVILMCSTDDNCGTSCPSACTTSG